MILFQHVSSRRICERERRAAALKQKTRWPSFGALKEVPRETQGIPRATAFLVASLPSQAQTTGDPQSSAPARHFVCNTGYTQKKCDEEMVVLKKALANYPTFDLGEWTWVLVGSEGLLTSISRKGYQGRSPCLVSTVFTFFLLLMVSVPS